MIANAAMPEKYAGISKAGRVENKHYDKLPKPVTKDRADVPPSHHLHRSDGTAYWPHNQGR